MDYNEILKEAAGLMGPYCKACPVCNGRACGNCVPGPGSKLPGNTAARNYDKWQEIFVNMDTLNPNANEIRPLSCSAKSSPPPYSSLRSALCPCTTAISTTISHTTACS